VLPFLGIDDMGIGMGIMNQVKDGLLMDGSHVYGPGGVVQVGKNDVRPPEQIHNCVLVGREDVDAVVDVVAVDLVMVRLMQKDLDRVTPARHELVDAVQHELSAAKVLWRVEVYGA
jgi:hypothetical protein